MTVTVREATRSDAHNIINLFKTWSAEEGADDQFQINPVTLGTQLAKHGGNRTLNLFGFIAKEDDDNSPVGIALCHFGDWNPITGAHSLQFDILLVPKSHEEKGVTKEILKSVAQLAKEGGADRIWHFLDGDDDLANNAFATFGAVDVAEIQMCGAGGMFYLMSIEGEALERLTAA